MPTISIVRDDLFKELGQRYSDEEFDELCFQFGIELDEITTVRQLSGTDNGSDEVVYRIDIPANRHDLLCIEGLSQALNVFLGRITMPKYTRDEPADLQELVIETSTQSIRPYAVGAVLRNVTLDPARYDSFIDLQDKLHQNICRKRSFVAIGTHDLDTIKGPFVYRALPAKDIKFRALNRDVVLDASELLEQYKGDIQLKAYVPLVADSPVVPVILDSKGVILSMPPIINSYHSRITLNTRNILIECTATDHTKALKAEEISRLLTRMCLTCQVDNQDALRVEIPPLRHDVLHACDVSEDVAIAYGYNHIAETLPSSATFSAQNPLNKLTDQLREQLAQAGFTEALTFALCSREDIGQKLRKPLPLDAVHVSNPKTLEFQVGRTTLLPGLLKTVAANRNRPLPIKVFEISDVLLQDSTKGLLLFLPILLVLAIVNDFVYYTEVGARNERRLCILHYGKAPGFEVVHGVLDRVMQLLGVPLDAETGYSLEPTEDGTFFPGRCASVKYQGRHLGSFGVIHPEVVTHFDLNMPCAALEFLVEPFL
nr:EOG090X03QT [Lepidurus arcticus]